MLTLLFIILILGFIFNIVKIALKFTWGISKFLFTVIVFPILIIAIALAGFFYIALAIMIIAGIISLITSLVVG